MQALTRSSGWIAVTLSTEALITSLSADVEKFTGYQTLELIGRPITQILSDRSVFEVQGILESAKECGYWEGKIIYQTGSGSPMEARCAITLLANRENHHSGYILISNFDESGNATDSRSGIRAEVSADLRAFAHELNNPLAVIMGFAQLLIQSTNCPDKIRSDIEILYSELERVVRIVERLHGYAISLYKKPPDRSFADVPMQNSA
jgi:PAS domain S-box-containing protein